MIERDPLIGQHLGAYQIQHKLGEGGMARVYKAYQPRLRRDVAIKVILAHIAEQSDFRARFEREAQLVASLEHPNIVAVYDFGEEGVITYLVMQYVAGGTLRDQLRDGHPLPSQQAAHYTLQMARALYSAHQRGIVHRDVKPQNMLVSAHNRDHLLLSDFGIAKLFDGSLDTTWTDATAGNVAYNNGQTSADQILGTLDYMAPEQINRKGVDARTDVYALGVVLFQMLTGRVPFLSSTTTGLMYQHVHVQPPLVRELNPAAPEVLAQITARALEKAPENRFQSAEAMAQALESALNAGGIGPGTHGLGAGYNGHADNMGTPPGMRSYEIMSAPGSSYGPPFYPSGPRSAQGQNTGPVQGDGTLDRAPTTGGRQSSILIPPYPPYKKHVRKSVSLQMVVGIIMLVVALALLVMRFQFFTGGNANPQATTGTARAFTETFANNNAGWIEGNINGLTSSVYGGHYTLSVAPENTYFPYPTKIGTLPKQFTLTAQIKQDTGNTQRAYGIVFYLNAQNSETKSCYAFVITSNKDYEVLKYDATGLAPALWQGNSPAIHGLHQSNTLQATVRHGTFSFKINGQRILLNNNKFSITDTTYSSGYAGLLVTGPNAQFTVTRVQLAIP